MSGAGLGFRLDRPRLRDLESGVAKGVDQGRPTGRRPVGVDERENPVWFQNTSRLAERGGQARLEVLVRRFLRSALPVRRGDALLSLGA